jgi:SAM-dependent methyltransferase
MLCPHDNFEMARTTGRGVWRCLYCIREFSSGEEVSRFIEFPEFTYNGPLHDYKRETDGLYAVILDFLERHQPLETPVLDVGGSDGPYRSFFPEGHYEIVDTHTPIIDGYIPIGGRFKTILCTEALEHFDDPIRLFSEFARLLAPDGKLMLTTPLAWGYHPSPKDYWRLQPDGFHYLTSRCGLAVELVEFMHFRDSAVMGLYVARKVPL